MRGRGGGPELVGFFGYPWAKPCCQRGLFWDRFLPFGVSGLLDVQRKKQASSDAADAGLGMSADAADAGRIVASLSGRVG